MKKSLSKKMTLSIIVGVMVTLAVIGAGTYAWFTSSATIDAAEFTTARVKLLPDEENEYRIYNFLTGHAQNIEYQKALEDDDGTVLAAWLANVNPDNQLLSEEYYAKMKNVEEYAEDIEEAQKAFDEAEAAWEAALGRLQGITDAIDNLPEPVEPVAPDRNNFPGGFLGTIQYVAAYAQYIGDLATYGQDLVNYYIEIGQLYAQLPAAVREALDAEGVLPDLQEALDDLLEKQRELIETIAAYAVFIEAEADRVTPGSLIYGTYSLMNDSNVPTYFRISEEETNLNGIAIIKAVAFNGTNVYTLVYDDGYYYSPYALAPDTEIKLVIGAYVMGEANENDVQEIKFSFGGTEIELIQASNNAVYLHDDWNPATVTFVDYTDPRTP